MTSLEVSRSIGLEPAEYENAKRRLATRLQQLMSQPNLSVADLSFGGRRVDRTG